MFAILSYLLLTVYLASTFYMLGLMIYLIVYQSKGKSGNPVVPFPKKGKFSKAA